MLDLMILSEVAGAAVEHHTEPTAFGLGPSAWVALSMVAVFGIMLKAKVPAMVAGMLDKRIGEIRTQLDEAAQLRKEADALNAEYEAISKAAGVEIAAMREAAAKDADEIVTKAKADVAALIARRTKMAEDKIAAAERAAIAEVRAKAANAASAAAAMMIVGGHDGRADRPLIDATIAGLDRLN
jgi:F-type H+-transporting ATPase subunit b